MAKQGEATLLLRIKSVGQEALNKTSEAIESLKSIALAAYAQISVAVGYALKQWHDQETATNRLNQVLVQQGIYTKELSESIHKQADALAEKSLYEDNAILQAQATLQTYLKEIPVSKELTQATLDLAASKGIDLASAAEKVGKTIGTTTNALQREGIEINAALPAHVKMAEAIRLINKEHGGLAEAATRGTGGFAMMSKALGEVAETAGKYIAPAFVIAAKAITDFANQSQRSNGLMQGFAQVAVFVLKVADQVVTTFQTLGASLGAIFAAIGSFSITNFKQSVETIKAINADVTAQNEAAWKASSERIAAYDQAIMDQKSADAQADVDLAKKTADRKVEIEREKNALTAADYQQSKIQEAIAQNEFLYMQQDQELQAKLQAINAKLAIEQDYVAKLALLRKKEELIEEATNNAKAAGADAYTKFKIYLASQEGQAVTSTLNAVSSLQTSKNKELAAIGKAAAITQATINTYLGITQALAHIPPPWGFVAAAAVGAAGFAQVANIAGVQLAEGGIVRATPGGVPATIGEGGRDEAVIPLDDPRTAERLGGLGGGGVTVHFNGPIMGDASQAREFAIALDRELYRLRREGQSISFDSRLT